MLSPHFPFYVAGKHFFRISRECGAWTQVFPGREKMEEGWGLPVNRALNEEALIQKL